MNEKNIAAIIANYIKQGWKLTSYSCPICGSPLISRDNDYFCPKCGKKVMIAKDENEAWRLIKTDIILQLEKKVIEKIKVIIDEEIDDSVSKLKNYLEILKQIKDLRD